jgi:predicted lipoprotein with Yx(FWY)xxD motif
MTKRYLIPLGPVLAVAALAACGGGGAATGASYTAPTNPSPLSTPAPAATTPAAAAATSAPAANSPLQTAVIDGSSTFVNSARLPIYTYSADSVNVSTCTGGCLAAWPAVLAPAGTLPAPFTSFKRSDNGAVQLEYNGQPLYTFVGDTADTANGAGDVVGSGTFNLAHPLAAATPPISTPVPGGGGY